MKGIVRLGVLAALLYLGYTRGGPWLERLRQSGPQDSVAGEADTASATCVGVARQAANSLASELVPLAAPGGDRGAWGTALIRTGAALSDAEDACRCGTDSCLQASRAISELHRIVEALNSAVRGAAPTMTNPANALERVDQLLAEADRLIAN